MTDQQSNIPRHIQARLDKISRAIDEIRERKGALTDPTYHQVIAALHNQRRQLQTDRFPNGSGSLEKEVRLVTVMFIDVVEATRIAVKLGDENWMGIMLGVHNRLSHIIQRWDGEIAQYLGDGILCYFGVHRSRGNDATRAVACALEIQQELNEYDTVVREEHPSIERFAGRIGISTGTAIVGPVGEAGNVAVFAIGRTTNFAARLQEKATAGGIAIDVETQLRVRSDFVIAPQKSLQFKGFEDEGPMAYYLVSGPKNRLITTFTTDRIADIPVPMFGRAGPFATLLEMLRHVGERGGFQAVTLYGETGIGKSRLLQEVAHSEVAGRFRLLRMIGHYERTDTAYSLLRDMIAAGCDIPANLNTAEAERRIKDYTSKMWRGKPGQAQSAAEIVGYLAGFGFANTPAVQSFHRSQLDHEAGVRHWVTVWLRGLAGERPILLLVDNLQWADAQSIRLLNTLHQDDGGPGGMALIAAARPEFKANPLATSFMAGATHTDYTLEPLDTIDTILIIRTVLKNVDDVPPDLTEVIVSRAQGNPMFVDEFLRMLFDTGVFERSDNPQRWRTNRLQYRSVKDTLPSGLQGVLQARLDDLPPPSKRVVQLGAVVGQTFWRSAVKRLTDTDTDTALGGILSDLVQRDILIHMPKSRLANDEEYTFRNALYHEVAYNMLPHEYRVNYHHQTAEWLAERISERPDMLGLLAEHYKHAQRPQDALQTYAEAATRQVTRNALTDAKRLIESGLAETKSVSRAAALPPASRLWLAQSQAAHAQRRYEEATAASETALRLMDELAADQMIPERVQASVTLANAHISLGNFDQAQTALEKTGNLLHGASGVNILGMRAVVMRSFGYLYWSCGDLTAARHHEQEALKAAETNGDPRVMATTLSMMGRISLDEGRFSDTLSYMRRVLDINRTVGRVVYQIADLYLMALAYYLLFQYEEALSMLDEAEQISSSVDFDMPLLAACRGLCDLGLGRNQDEALRRIHDASDRGVITISDRHSLRLFSVRAMTTAGHHQAALNLSKTLAAELKNENPVLYGRSLLWAGVAQQALGQPEAAETLRHALEMEQKHAGRDLWLCQYAYSTTIPDAATAQAIRQQADAALQAAVNKLPLSHPADAVQRLRVLFPLC